MLLSALLEHCFAEAAMPGSALLYHYYDFREKESQKARTALGTFLCQACTQLGAMPSEMNSFISRHTQEGRELMEPTYEELERVLGLVLQEFPFITITVDALDECLDREKMLGLLCRLTRDAQVRVLVSGREEPDIQQAFQYNHCKSIAVQAHGDDVDSFVSEAIETSPRLHRLKAEFQNHIRDVLGNRAHGMWRWLAMQVESLRSLRTDRDIRRALQALPKDLNETYDRILGCIQASDRPIASKALMWLSHAARPLRLRELAEAAILEDGMTSMDLESRIYPEDLLEIIGSLVLYDPAGEAVVLAHHSVKDYLESQDCRANNPDFHFGTQGAQTAMAYSCLTYLLLDDFADGLVNSAVEYKDRIERYPLLQYAARYWPLHACRTPAAPGNWLPLALALLQASRTGNFWSWLQAMIVQGPFSYRIPDSSGLSAAVRFRRIPRNLTPLYYAASFGLVEVVENLIHQGVDVNEEGGLNGGTALHAAFYRGQVNVQEILMGAGALTDIHDRLGNTPFKYIPFGEERWLRQRAISYARETHRNSKRTSH